MSTIKLVDPELRDALALWPQVSLTAETLTRRRADALALLSSVPTPDLPDIATSEIHVESAFGAKPIRVLTYRPIRSNDPLPVILISEDDNAATADNALKANPDSPQLIS